MEEQKVIISENLEPALAEAIQECRPDRLLVLTDETTRQLCWPVVSSYDCLREAQLITIKAGDDHKTLDSLSHVWQELQRLGATRHSLLINLGGGMVTDLGGFAASTFKRGLHIINIPTTLLAMVDASVGGKTGINFGGLKNEVGVFRNASAVILDTTFLRTLDHENILSGYAEMLKHGLIGAPSGAACGALLNFDIDHPDLRELGRMVAESVQVKQRIVLEDPLEQGLRKALNLGHTVGHAFESMALQRTPVLHGYAVAWGLVCELYLSVVKCGFPTDKMRQVVHFIFDHYGRMPITCDDYPTLLELMTHDKKNVAGQINFTLLSNVGQLQLNQTATTAEIEEALDFYREGM
jgi:3-dehydroquinate synthase